MPDALGLLEVAGRHALALPLADTMLAGWLLAGAGIEVPQGPLTVAPSSDATLRDGRAAGRAWAVPWGRHAGVVVLIDDQVVLLMPGAFTAEPGADIAGDPRDEIVFDAAVPSGPAAHGATEVRAAGAATRTLLIAGALQAVTDMTVQYANDRSQFGKPIGRHQAVQQSIAVLAGQAAAAAAAAGIAAEAMAHGVDLPAIAAAKARAGEAAGIGAAIAHQVHGAIGFTAEHALHRFTRRLWAWRDAWGNEAEWSARLGRHLAAAGPAGLWPAMTAL